MKQKKLLQIIILVVIILIAALLISLFIRALNSGGDSGPDGFLFENLPRFGELVLLAALLALLFLRLRTVRNDETNVRERERQSLEDLISDKISEQYYNIYCIDMDADRVIYAANPETAVRHYGESVVSGDDRYSRITAVFCQTLVLPEDRERVAEAIALDVVRKKLSEHRTFSMICRCRVNGVSRYMELHFIRLQYREGVRHFIWAFTDAEERMRAEIQKYEQTAVISGLAEDFDCVSYADLGKNTITDHRVGELLSESIDGWDETVNYTAKMMLFANALVLPSEREDLLQKVEIETVRENLAQRGVYYADTRVSLHGKEHVYQIKFVADAAIQDHAIVGFHNISEAIAKRRRSMMETTVLEGLTSDFECVAYVEMADNRVTTCRTSELFAGYIPGWRTVTDYAVRVRLLADALVIEEDRPRFLFQTSPEQVIRGVTDDPVYYVVFRIKYDDNVQIYQAKYIRDPNNKTNVILGIHNVDNEKKRELERHAEEDAERVKSDFLTQMSRDILSPLNGIHSTLQKARDNISDAETLQMSLEKADVTAQYLSRLVSDVLNMTRRQGDGFEIINEPMNMRLFVERCCAAIEEQAKENEIRLVRYFDDIAHPFVLSDGPHLRQILLNLLNNAVKFTPKGGQITFRVSELISSEDSVTFKIDIADSGNGMDRRILEHIWDVFALRADTSSPDNTGTGLGLAVCKMIADMMGATITVDSKVGEGSCFSVLLPMELNRDAYEESAEDASVLNGLRVMVAEDNELSMSVLSEMLSDSGAILLQTGNGKEALEQFRASGIGEIDLVLLDNLMPEMNGIAASKAIRALPRPDAATVTIIGMSTGISDEDLASFKAAGISAYIEKPIQLTTLVNTLLTCVHNRSQILERALAVANESSVKDALTGVRNRTAYERLEMKMNSEIEAGNAEPFAFVFCDVNNLKYTNDTFGHERGDELIRNACRQICDVFRHSAVFRMGGDEFAAILQGGDYEIREELVGRLQPSEAYGNVSIACGIAEYDPGTDKDLMSVLKRADARMYENKREMKRIPRD